MENRDIMSESLYNAVCAKPQRRKSNNKNRHLLGIPLLITIDLLAIVISVLAAVLLRDSILQPLLPNLFRNDLLANTISRIWLLPLIVVFCLIYENLYQKRIPFWIEAEILVKAVTLSVFLTIVWLYMTKVNEEISRTLIVLTWLILIIFLPVIRYYGKLLLTRLNLWNRQAIIIGNGEAAKMITRAFQREKTLGYEIIGAITDHPRVDDPARKQTPQDYPILGSLKDAEKIIAGSGVQDVIIALSGIPAKKQVAISNRFQQLTCNVILVPELFGLSLSGIELLYFFEEQTLLITIKNRLKSNLNKLIKQIMDLSLGTLLTLICLPLLLLLALAVKLDSRGPVFYKCRRLGQQGRIFKCFKFRTMRQDAYEILQAYLSENQAANKQWEKYRKLNGADPRVTRVGKFLRRFSLDELPQLINVLKGEMSLVGPRPYMVEEKELIGDWFGNITVARPGITGLWQVSGRNRISFIGRVELDSWYIKNWSPWLDLLILFRTIKVVITADGAY